MVAATLATLKAGRPGNEIAQNCAIISQDEAADLLNVSRRSVQTAKKVIEHGAEELADQQATSKQRGPSPYAAA